MQQSYSCDKNKITTINQIAAIQPIYFKHLLPLQFEELHFIFGRRLGRKTFIEWNHLEDHHPPPHPWFIYHSVFYANADRHRGPALHLPLPSCIFSSNCCAVHSSCFTFLEVSLLQWMRFTGTHKQMPLPITGRSLHGVLCWSRLSAEMSPQFPQHQEEPGKVNRMRVKNRRPILSEKKYNPLLSFLPLPFPLSLANMLSSHDVKLQRPELVKQ